MMNSTMHNTNFNPVFEVEYVIWIVDLVELLTKEDSRITHDLIWEVFRYDWGGQNSYYRAEIEDFIVYLCDAFGYSENNEVEPEDLDAFISKPITDEMEPKEVLYRIVIQKMTEGVFPEKFLVLNSW